MAEMSFVEGTSAFLEDLGLSEEELDTDMRPFVKAIIESYGHGGVAEVVDLLKREKIQDMTPGYAFVRGTVLGLSIYKITEDKIKKFFDNHD